MKRLTVGSCFSGIGGLELGLEWTGGFETKWQIEIDPYATKVLEKHWPDVQRFSDITTVAHPPAVDVICGGFPCQPFSSAGNQLGKDDHRYLWPEMLRLIKELHPAWIIGENVSGFISMELENALSDLEAEGYTNRDSETKIDALVIPAGAVGANHRRDRVWILAHTQKITIESPILQNQEGPPRVLYSKPRRVFSHKTSSSHWETDQPGFIEVDDGIPSWVGSVGCYGNAVVPQVAQKVGEMILEYERRKP